MEEALLKAFALLQETGQRNLEISAEILKILLKESETVGSTLSDILESIDNRLAVIERALSLPAKVNQPAQPLLTEQFTQLEAIVDTSSAASVHAEPVELVYDNMAVAAILEREIPSSIEVIVNDICGYDEEDENA